MSRSELRSERKLCADGTFRACHGCTIISLCTQSLAAVEAFLRASLLSDYYSPLPASSYHITNADIWCHGDALIEPLLEYIDAKCHVIKRRESVQVANEWRERRLEKTCGDESGWHWTEAVLFPLLKRARALCRKHISSEYNFALTAPVARGVILVEADIVDDQMRKNADELRTAAAALFGRTKPYKQYHMTLAYCYRSVPEWARPMVDEEIAKLGALLETTCKMQITVSSPDVYWFDSMTNFLTMEQMEDY